MLVVPFSGLLLPEACLDGRMKDDSEPTASRLGLLIVPQGALAETAHHCHAAPRITRGLCKAHAQAKPQLIYHWATKLRPSESAAAAAAPCRRL